MTFSTLFVRSFALGACLCLVACGDSTVAPADDQGDTDTTSDVSTDASADGTTDESGGDGAVTDGAIDGALDGATDVIVSDAGADGEAPPVCADRPTKVGCQDCCGLEHPAGQKTFAAALLACACTDAICKTECSSTACATPSVAPSDVCKACLNESIRAAKPDAGPDGGGDGKCVDSVKSACSSDAKCVAYATCLNTCK